MRRLRSKRIWNSYEVQATCVKSSLDTQTMDFSQQWNTYTKWRQVTWNRSSRTTSLTPLRRSLSERILTPSSHTPSFASCTTKMVEWLSAFTKGYSRKDLPKNHNSAISCHPSITTWWFKAQLSTSDTDCWHSLYLRAPFLEFPLTLSHTWRQSLRLTMTDRRAWMNKRSAHGARII